MGIKYFNFLDNNNNYYPVKAIKEEGYINKEIGLDDDKYCICIYLKGTKKYFYYDEMETRDFIFEEIKKLKGIKD